MKTEIRPAQAADFEPVAQFLVAAKLPVSDLPDGLPGFFLAFAGDQLAATAGVEIFGKIGLLRSVAVAPDLRSKGIGEQTFRAAIARARADGAAEIWLITNTAEAYFAKRGFQRMERAAAPPEIAATEQFNGLCPNPPAQNPSVST